MTAPILTLHPRAWSDLSRALSSWYAEGHPLHPDACALYTVALDLARQGQVSDLPRQIPAGEGRTREDGPMDEQLLDVAAAAKVASVSTRTLYRRIQDGSLSSVKLRGRRLIRFADLLQWIQDENERTV